MEDNPPLEHKGVDMEIGYLDLEALKVVFYAKTPNHIPPQQVSLLEKAIIKTKTMKCLGIAPESLKDPDGKKKGRK